jgi:hypothetical protein
MRNETPEPPLSLLNNFNIKIDILLDLFLVARSSSRVFVCETELKAQHEKNA